MIAILIATDNTIKTIKINANFATRLLDSINSFNPNHPPPDEERPASPGFEKLDVIPPKIPPPPLPPLSVIYKYLLRIYYYIYVIKKQPN